MRRFLVGFLATVGVLALLLVLTAGVGAYWLVRGREAPALPGRMMLVADLREDLPEAPPGTLQGLRLGRRPTVSDVVLALDRAGRDPRVAGLVARLDDTSNGLATAQELRDAVTRFRASGGGRFAVAHAETFGELGPGNEGYYLAAAFERIDLQPAGLVGLTGLAAEIPSFGGLLADLGVELEVARRAEYKSAFEPLTEREITPANREVLESVLDELSRQLAEGVAAGRGLDAATTARLVGGGPYTAAEAEAAGLIDEIGHLDATLAAARVRAGGQDVATVSVEDYWGRVQEEAAGGGEADAAGAAGVALIREVGLIRRGDGGVGREIAADEAAASLDEAIEDPAIRAILLRLDTGGGSAVASETVAHQVRRAVAAGKPVVVSMADAAASGGYWIAAEASRLVAQPATLTGSIGVVAGKPVLARLWERLNVNWTEIRRGENAGITSVNEPYSPAARARIEAVLDGLYGEFKAKVAAGRNLDAAQVEEVARGRVWTGSQAQRLGLVDRLGGLHEAMAAVREELKLPADAPLRLTVVPPPESPLERLSGLLSEGLDGVQTIARLGGLVSMPGILTSPSLAVR